MMHDYLLDKDFLQQVDQYYQRETYVKIIALDFDENPVAEIQGNIVSGSISINGESSVRRTCNLSLITTNTNITETDWSLYTKFKVYIGLKNFIDSKQYEDILWFNQGIYIITAFSTTINQQGLSVSISGRDKMCLLNGDLGGNLFAAHDFGKEYIYNDDGSITIESIPIYTIIREAIHTYALEPYSNIVINDLDDCAVELLSYRAKNCPLYIVEQEMEDGIVESNMVFAISNLGQALEEIYAADNYYDNMPFTYEGHNYIAKKRIDYGDTAGYRITDLTYAGDLILSVGDSLTSMLDKIITMLGEFEYFYDINGRFIFQRKKIYYNVPWNNAITTEKETYYEDMALSSMHSYNFSAGLLIESLSNKPNINNIKNDFAIWGMRTTTSGTKVPIHLRYAIDIKPKCYYSYTQKKLFLAKEAGGGYDWRELIYQMAVDNSIEKGKMEELKTQIQQEGLAAIRADKDIQNLTEIEQAYLSTWDSGYDAYYADLLSFWREIYNADGKKYIVDNADNFIEEKMSQEEWNEYVNNDYWNPILIKSVDSQLYFQEPELLTFWIDFIDSEYLLDKYGIGVIGRRTKVINDEGVKAIFFRDTPDVLFIRPDTDEVYEDSSLSYVRMNIPPAYANYFTISAQGKSAKETLDNLVYQHTYYQESISISAIPIYYLEPNTRIAIYDQNTNIAGDYLIKSIGYSLAHDGMMTITATKAVDRIL